MISFEKSNFPNIILHSLKDINILDTLAPAKHKYVRANQAPFMIKTRNKAVMDRSIFKKTPENWLAYKKQRNSCISLFRK